MAQQVGQCGLLVHQGSEAGNYSEDRLLVDFSLRAALNARMRGTVLTGGRAHRQYCNVACGTRASQGRQKAQVGEALTDTRTDVERLAALPQRTRRRIE